jgi:hypothetical protein
LTVIATIPLPPTLRHPEFLRLPQQSLVPTAGTGVPAARPAGEWVAATDLRAIDAVVSSVR